MTKPNQRKAEAPRPRFAANVFSRTLMITIFVGLFIIFIASHTVPALAIMTGKAIFAASGVNTLAINATDMISRNRQLQTNLENERRLSSDTRSQRDRLTTELADTRMQLETSALNLEDSRTTNLKIQADLESERRVSANAISLRDRTNLDLENTRAQLQTAEIDLRTARLEAAGLAAELNQHNRKIVIDGIQMNEREATRHTLTKVGTRTRRAAAVNLGSLAGEAIPFYGIGIIIGATTYELRSACENMRDLHELSVAVFPENAIAEDRDAVCGMEVPTRDEIWSIIVSSPQLAWNAATDAIGDAGQAIAELKMPDFGLAWQTAVSIWSRGADWWSGENEE